MACRNWIDLNAGDFANLPETTIAILPTAAVEQHGPHLPFGTDTIIAEGMLKALHKQCPDDLDLLVLPVQAVGKSNEHLWAAGTLTLSAETALRAWEEIGLSVARAGVKKIVLINSHGGNLALIEILARELRVKADMLAIKCQWMSFGTPEGLYSEHELKYGIHGGDIETSLLLHLTPDLVDMDAAQDFRSSAETTPIPPIGPVSYGWASSDLNAAGVIGQAHLASAEKGKATIDWQVTEFIKLLRSVNSMELPLS